MDNKLTKTFHLILQVITVALSSFINGHVCIITFRAIQTATMHYAELSFHLPYATHKGVYVIVINTFLKEIKFSFIVFIITLLCSASSLPVHEINIVMLLYYLTITGIPKLWIANGSWSSLRPVLNKSNSAYTLTYVRWRADVRNHYHSIHDVARHPPGQPTSRHQPSAFMFSRTVICKTRA